MVPLSSLSVLIHSIITLPTPPSANGWSGPLTAVTRGHYNLDQAQTALLQTVFWSQVVNTARALALVHGGEIQEGTELATTSAQSCYETGNMRMLDRIYMIQQYLDRITRQYSTLSAGLRDVLDGGREAEF